MAHVNNDTQNHIKELNALYQEVIVEHYKRPRFKQTLTDCRFCQEGKNPVCGDVISVYCKVFNQNACPALQVTFNGSGCAISQASASIMCETVHNKNLQQAKDAIKQAEQIYTGQSAANPDDLDSDIEALSGISQFPARVKCAALPWKTLECLIQENFDDNGNPISTSCTKNLQAIKQQKKLRVVSTEQ